MYAHHTHTYDFVEVECWLSPNFRHHAIIASCHVTEHDSLIPSGRTRLTSFMRNIVRRLNQNLEIVIVLCDFGIRFCAHKRDVKRTRVLFKIRIYGRNFSIKDDLFVFQRWIKIPGSRISCLTISWIATSSSFPRNEAYPHPVQKEMAVFRCRINATLISSASMGLPKKSCALKAYISILTLVSTILADIRST